MKHSLSRAARRAGAVLATVALSAGLVACAGQHEGQGHTPADGTWDSITYLEPQTFNTLYPPAAGFYPNGVIVNQITDRLLYQDPDTLELSPWIATELPEVNADATEYTFKIRTDVTYSDGSPLTAQNVVNNIDLYGLGDKSRTLTSSEQITNYERGEVLSPDTVRFHFSAPAPGFAQAVSSYNAGLLSDATIAKNNQGFAPGSATQISGSGPFTIVEEELGTSLVLQAREDYSWAPPAREHQGPARLDEIRLVVAQEQSVRIGGLVAGQADIARQIDAPEEKHLENAGYEVLAAPTNGMNNQLMFRFRNPKVSDIRVRQAIIHGIDREEILYTLFSDSYVMATSSMARNGQGYKEQPAEAYAYDPERSKKLLDEAGWVPGSDGIRVKDGLRLSLNINEALPQPRSREVITKVQEHLLRIGVEITLNPGDMATQNADSLDPEKIPFRHSMVARADYDVIKSLYHSDNRNDLLNGFDGTVADQHLDDLLQGIASSPDEKRRAELSGQVQDYLTEQAYVLPLFEEPIVYGIAPYLKGFGPETVGRPSFYEAWIDHDLKEAK